MRPNKPLVSDNEAKEENHHHRFQSFLPDSRAFPVKLFNKCVQYEIKHPNEYVQIDKIIDLKL